MENLERKSNVNKISAINIAINVLLSIFKFVSGIISGSAAMISDALESTSDILSTFIVLLGINYSAKCKDDDHQYGHDDFESIASIILSVILFITAIAIAVKGGKSVYSAIMGNPLEAPTKLALIASVITIAVKEAMFQYTKLIARRIGSNALLADAWHQRSDAISSIGTFLGILGAVLGFPILDPIAAIAISFLIVRVAFKIGLNAISEVTDHAADISTQDKIYEIVRNTEGVKRIDELKTRKHGSSICIDIDIAVDGHISVHESHEIADAVSNNVQSNLSCVAVCMVHVNPY